MTMSVSINYIHNWGKKFWDFTLLYITFHPHFKSTTERTHAQAFYLTNNVYHLFDI
jgi:hypothetical protein